MSDDNEKEGTSKEKNGDKGKVDFDLLLERPPKKEKIIKKKVSDFLAPSETLITFKDVGGYIEVKKRLKRIARGLEDPDYFYKNGIRCPIGILLFGPPGTGKTLLAKALANEGKALFIEISAGDLLSKWYGEAEKRIKRLFDYAIAERPAIILIHELDTLYGDREGAYKSSRDTVNELLIQMDRIRETQGVIVIGTTNRKHGIDAAALRSGRFGRQYQIEVGLPSQEERKEILQVHIKSQNREKLLKKGFDLGLIAEKSEDLSGADLEEILNIAMFDRLDHMEEGGRPYKITTRHILRIAESKYRDKKENLVYIS